eukprot:7305066-Lingulodinium_polyedra.AAC.1
MHVGAAASRAAAASAAAAATVATGTEFAAGTSVTAAAEPRYVQAVTKCANGVEAPAVRPFFVLRSPATSRSTR